MKGENPEISLHKLMSTINSEIAAGLQKSGDLVTKDTTDNRRQLGRFICVQVAGIEMAIRLSSIIEAGELASVRQLPLLPAWLSGVTNIRGKIVSVVDLSRFLGANLPVTRENRSFLVVSKDSLELAITVQRILSTRVLYQRSGKKVPDSADISFQTLVSGHAWYEQNNEWRPIPLFNLERFLSSEKLLQPEV